MCNLFSYEAYNMSWNPFCPTILHATSKPCSSGRTGLYLNLYMVIARLRLASLPATLSTAFQTRSGDLDPLKLNCRRSKVPSSSFSSCPNQQPFQIADFPGGGALSSTSSSSRE